MNIAQIIDSLDRAQYAAMAIEAVSMPETVDELGGDNIHAAIYIILRSLRAELDQAESMIKSVRNEGKESND